MTKQQAIDSVNRCMTLLLADFSSCSRMLADEFDQENFLPSHVAFSGRYFHAKGLQKYLEPLAVTWLIGKLAFDDFIVDPETRIPAATGVERNGEAVATGLICNMSFVWEFQFAPDGKLTYVRQYTDPAATGRPFDVI